MYIKHWRSYSELQPSPLMPQFLSLRSDGAPRSHGRSLLSTMVQLWKVGIRNWFFWGRALFCLIGYLWDGLSKMYALKHAHTPPWWVKGIQEVSQSLMQELWILLVNPRIVSESITAKWCHKLRKVQNCHFKFTAHAFKGSVCGYF